MPFVGSYSKAMSILSEIGNGKCADRCKSVWIRNFKYALKDQIESFKTDTIYAAKIDAKNSARF